MKTTLGLYPQQHRFRGLCLRSICLFCLSTG